MNDLTNHQRVVPVRNLRDYFRTSMNDVMEKQGVEVDPHATHYVVNLITLFSRSEAFYENDGESYGLRPLALMLADAADAPTAADRNQTLQRIGDVSLFVAGFFVDGLAKGPVDVGYYMQMGGNAYGSLSEEVRGTFRGDAFADVYRELSEKFAILIDILNEVGEAASDDGDIDWLRTYETWRKTGSRRCEALLRGQGVVSIADNRYRRH